MQHIEIEELYNKLAKAGRFKKNRKLASRWRFRTRVPKVSSILLWVESKSEDVAEYVEECWKKPL